MKVEKTIDFFDKLRYIIICDLYHMEWYRSGHNELHWKCSSLNGLAGSNPAHSATSRHDRFCSFCPDRQNSLLGRPLLFPKKRSFFGRIAPCGR